MHLLVEDMAIVLVLFGSIEKLVVVVYRPAFHVIVLQDLVLELVYCPFEDVLEFAEYLLEPVEVVSLGLY